MAKHEPLSVVELQNLREDAVKLLSGEKTLKELVFEVKNIFLPNRYLPKFILDKAGIGIGSQYGYGLDYKLRFNQDPLTLSPEPPQGLIAYGFQQPTATLALSFISQLLDDRTMRKHVIDYLVGDWKPGYKEWLAEFVNGLDGKSLMHLLLEPQLKDTGKLNTKDFRKSVMSLIGEERIAEVIQAAEQARKLVSLYELTGWPGCQGRGGFLERKQILTMDMDI